MCCDDKFDEWIDVLCRCEDYWECEWHRRLRRQHETRRDLGEQMEDIVGTSNAIHVGVSEVPEDWELIRGSRGEYWAPANRGY